VSAGPVRGRAELGGGDGHICLVVDEDREYVELAAVFLSEGSARHEKTVTFGPQNSPAQQRLRELAVIAADPYVDVFGRGEFDPERMFAMFRQQAAKALEEGYSRLRVAADMDSLLPIACRDEALRFEVLLGRVVSEVDATVLCAYRRTSFMPDTILGMLCTHPITAGHGEWEPLKLVVGDDGCWVLSGQLDVTNSSVLVPALRATAGKPWVVDASGLAFADVSGMRAIAVAADHADRTLHVRGASEKLKRYWRLAEFDRAATRVTFES
jgi:anti-anti-sigma regulatory factor